MSSKKHAPFAKTMYVIEKKFQDMINDVPFVRMYKNVTFNKLQKLTVELLYDGYLPPESYFIKENYLLHRYPLLYFNIARKGGLHLLRDMINFIRANKLSYCMDQIYQEICSGAIYGGQIEIINWMFQNNIFVRTDSMAVLYAIRGGNLNMIQWLHNICKITYKIMMVGDDVINLFKVAARYGHQHVINWLISVGLTCDYGLYFLGAAEGLETRGHFEYPGKTPDKINVLKWATNLDTAKTIKCDLLAGADDPTLFEWAVNKGYPYGKYVCLYAARHNYNDRLIQFYNAGHRLNSATYSTAAGQCDIDTLEWLVSLPDKVCFNKKAHNLAATYGKLKNIKWLQKNICPFDDEILEHCYDDSEILQYVLKNGIKLNNNICYRIIDNENVELLDIIRENYDWLPKYDEYILMKKHKGMIAWTKSNL